MKRNEQRELRFIVTGQKIDKDKTCDFSGLVSGTKNYLVAKFKFSEEWRNMKKVAMFSVLGEGFIAIIDSNFECIIPSDALVWTSFGIKVLGKSKNGDQVITDEIIIQQKRG